VAVRLTGAPCRNVTVTLVGSMAALNHTRMSAVTLTFTAPSAGDVAVIYGPLHTVVKEKKIGPGVSQYPFLFIPSTTIVKIVQDGKGFVGWDNVSTVSPPDHEIVSGNVGMTVTLTELVFIGSLNVTTRSSSRPTPKDPSAGLVETTKGGPQVVVKVHEYGPRARPNQSWACAVTVYCVHHARGVVCVNQRSVSLFDHVGTKMTGGVIDQRAVDVFTFHAASTTGPVVGTFVPRSAGLMSEKYEEADVKISKSLALAMHAWPPSRANAHTWARAVVVNMTGTRQANDAFPVGNMSPVRKKGNDAPLSSESLIVVNRDASASWVTRHVIE